MRSTKVTRVLVFGTFDLLHPGHVSFLRQAKRRGTELIVAVGRDRNVTKLKGRRAHHTERRRLSQIAALPFVYRALLAPKNPSQRYAFIKRLKPEVLALGYDQSHYTQDLALELKKRHINCRVIRLRPYRPTVYKSSLLRPALARLKKT